MALTIHTITAAALAVLFTVISGSASATDRPGVQLDVGVANPLMLSETQATNYLRIALQGGPKPQGPQRAAVNVAIVIDRSGSMQGRKIEEAKQAAIAAVGRLTEHDIVSVVLYSAGVEVLVPSTKATDREDIVRRIEQIHASGGTALFAGVSKGADEVRKFLSKESVNRVILLSDGHANVGPSSPSDLESLGRSLIKEGISVSTMGLGASYNEDLMTQLASAAAGNHVFVEDAEHLVDVFNHEFDDLMSVVASDIDIRVQLGRGIRPVRVLGTHAKIEGRRVNIPLAQLYAGQQRYFIVEIEVDSLSPKGTIPLADVSVRFSNLVTDTIENRSRKTTLRFSPSADAVKAATDWETLAFCSVQLITERNRTATALRDAGKVAAAKELLQQNADQLQTLSVQCRNNNVLSVLPELQRNYNFNSLQSVAIEDNAKWNIGRKSMRQYQIANEQQQTYTVTAPEEEK